MAAKLFLRGRVWWCWGYDVDGKRWQESTHQRDRRAAELAAREIERRYAADPAHRTRSKLTLAKALEIVLDYQQQASKAPATLRATRYHAEHLIEHIDPQAPLSSITLADTTAYLRKRLAEGAHRHTIAKELRTLTQAMRRCAKLGVFVATVDPRHFVPDELGKVYTPRSRWLTRAEYEALLKDLGASLTHGHRRSSQDRRDYLVVWCNVGLRKTELFDVQAGHYDAERHELFVDGTKTEEAHRIVSLNEEAEEVIARRVQAAGEGPVFPVWHTVVRDLKAACARAGIPPVTPNDLRRTFCSWLCQEGVPEALCADMMGHTSTTMVRSVYGHYDRISMAAAVGKLSKKRRPVSVIELTPRRSAKK